MQTAIQEQLLCRTPCFVGHSSLALKRRYGQLSQQADGMIITQFFAEYNDAFGAVRQASHVCQTHISIRLDNGTQATQRVRTLLRNAGFSVEADQAVCHIIPQSKGQLS